MTELECTPLDEIVKELKRRNMTFVLAWVDHQQFTKIESMAQEIVWGIESGGNLALQETLMRFLRSWHAQLVRQSTQPGSGAEEDRDE